MKTDYTGMRGQQKKILSYTFLNRNCLKQGDALWPLRFNFSSVYAIRNDQANHEEFKLSGTCRLLSYGDDITILGEEISHSEENTETL